MTGEGVPVPPPPADEVVLSRSDGLLAAWSLAWAAANAPEGMSRDRMLSLASSMVLALYGPQAETRPTVVS